MNWGQKLLIVSREYSPVALRQLVIDRACGYCEYCRSSGDFALESMEFEHLDIDSHTIPDIFIQLSPHSYARVLPAYPWQCLRQSI
jgi:hypothetical protein